MSEYFLIRVTSNYNLRKEKQATTLLQLQISVARTRAIPRINITRKTERSRYALLVSAQGGVYEWVLKWVCLGEPDAPTNVQVGDGASGANELKFTWTAPDHQCDTDFPVIRYRFLCSGGGSTPIDVISVSAEQSVAESSFQPSIRYNCSVSAENSIGNSSQSIPFLLRGEYRYFDQFPLTALL